MRSRRHTQWLQWMTALLAGIALALGGTACERNQGGEMEESGQQGEEVEREEFGVFDEETEQEGAPSELDQQAGLDQDEELGQEELGQEELGQAELGQQAPQTGQLQPGAEQGGDISLENLDPSQVNDQDLTQFAQIQLRLNQAREDGAGATGGGPTEGDELEEWETEMIQNSGMNVDKYLAIRMMLEDEPELKQRYDQVIEQIHNQPAQQPQLPQ